MDYTTYWLEKWYFDTLFLTQYIHRSSLVIFYLFIFFFFLYSSLMYMYCVRDLCQNNTLLKIYTPYFEKGSWSFIDARNKRRIWSNKHTQSLAQGKLNIIHKFEPSKEESLTYLYDLICLRLILCLRLI
jgi:hypothetical protein